MLILKGLVLLAMIGAVLFFVVYGWALTSSVIDDAKNGRVMELDPTGQSLLAAAKYGFFIGFSIFVVALLALGVK